MAKLQKHLGLATAVATTIATLFPSVWGIILSAALATALTVWAAGLKWIESPAVHSSVLIFAAFLWTFIGLAWLAGRRKPVEIFPTRDYRFGLTFQGIVPNFQITNEEGALQIGIALQNYCPGPLRYTFERFDVRIDTRSLPDIEAGALSSFMPRGASRTSSNKPFKKDHIREFLGTRQEGTLSFSIIYGDAEGEPSRRLKMTLHLYFEFPNDVPGVYQGFQPPLGFTANILTESDESI